MSEKDMQERQADAFSNRRKLLERDRRPEFDQYYGTQQAGGAMKKGRYSGTGAGKGDARRPENKELYDIGHQLTRKDLTDERRLELERRWYELRGLVHPGDG